MSSPHFWLTRIHPSHRVLRKRPHQVTLLCRELDAEVEAFRTRPLAGNAYPYVWLDATFIKGRQAGPGGRVVAQAVVIAIGLNATTGQREVLGLDVGPSEDGAF